jgi:hypothetical protein
MEKGKFSWPFAKNRQMWIETADRCIAAAADEIEGLGEPLTPQHCRQYRRAALKYERSAKHYRRAGLGVMAVASWQDAAECYAAIGADKDFIRCEHEELSIETYWEEEDDAP